jgi:hypothetical protein
LDQVGVLADVVVEVGPHLADREHADHHREREQDRERQDRRGQREPPADGQHVEARDDAWHQTVLRT